MSTKSDAQEGETRAKAFEQAYKDTHPNGPFPPVELKPKLKLEK